MTTSSPPFPFPHSNGIVSVTRAGAPILDPVEPPFVLRNNRKYHEHAASSSGATLVAETNRCPTAGYYSWRGGNQPPDARKKFSLERGTIVHSLLLGVLLSQWGWIFPDWATAVEMVDAEMARIKEADHELWKKLSALRNAGNQTTIQMGAIAALAPYRPLRLLAAEHQFVIDIERRPLYEGNRRYQTYTPRIDAALELEDGSILLIDWKTTSLPQGQVKDEAVYHGASTQFQGMYLAGRAYWPDRPIKVAVGIIRFGGPTPLVEILPIREMNAGFYADAICASLNVIGTFTHRTLAGEPHRRVGATSCHTPYGACAYFDLCHGVDSPSQ